jgi:hypothetical protein
VGLIVMLARWCCLAAQAGGLATADSKKTASILLQSILSVVHDSTWRMSLVFVKAWQCRWPRPKIDEGNIDSFDVKVSKGMVDLSKLAHMGLDRESRASTTKLNIVRALKAHLKTTDDFTVPLLDFLLTCCQVKTLSLLFGQVCWSVSQQLEHMLGSVSDKGIALGTCMFEWVDWKETILSLMQQGRSLVAYVSNGSWLIGSQFILGCSTDKASVGKLPLQNTVFLTPQNQAVLASPVVAHSSTVYDPIRAVFSHSVCP